MTQQETNVWKSAQLLVCRIGDGLSRVFRNQRYKGKIVKGNTITNGYADCGVGGDGGHDLIGWHSFIIQPHHVGKRIAQYLSIETKVKDGRRGDDQKTMASVVKESGGLSGFAENDDDVKKIIQEWD